MVKELAGLVGQGNASQHTETARSDARCPVGHKRHPNRDKSTFRLLRMSCLHLGYMIG